MLGWDSDQSEPGRYPSWVGLHAEASENNDIYQLLCYIVIMDLCRECKRLIHNGTLKSLSSIHYELDIHYILC